MTRPRLFVQSTTHLTVTVVVATHCNVRLFLLTCGGPLPWPRLARHAWLACARALAHACAFMPMHACYARARARKPRACMLACACVHALVCDVHMCALCMCMCMRANACVCHMHAHAHLCLFAHACVGVSRTISRGSLTGDRMLLHALRLHTNHVHVIRKVTSSNY